MVNKMTICPIQNNKEITLERCRQLRELNLCYNDGCRNEVESDEVFDTVLALFEPIKEDC